MSLILEEQQGWGVPLSEDDINVFLYFGNPGLKT